MGPMNFVVVVVVVVRVVVVAVAAVVVLVVVGGLQIASSNIACLSMVLAIETASLSLRMFSTVFAIARSRATSFTTARSLLDAMIPLGMTVRCEAFVSKRRCCSLVAVIKLFSCRSRKP